MIVKEWVYKDHRIALELLGGNYRSSIYEPNNPAVLSYTPIVEMKHGQQATETAAEKFLDERLEKKNPAR